MKFKGEIRKYNMKANVMKKRSIRQQFAVTAIVLIASTILICLIANVLFLEKVYTKDKKSSLVETYQELNESAQRGNLTSEEFLIKLENACTRYNLDIIVLNEMNYPIITSAMNYEALGRKLLQYILGIPTTSEVLIREEKYVIVSAMDTRTATVKMEMWGRLDNGYTFLFSTPMESIKESAAISSKFLCIIGMISVILGGIIAWIYSGKISNPILKLAQLSEKITKLDFDAKYTGNDRNEIGILGNNMNSLSESLEQTISELKTANLELQHDIEKKEEMDLQRQEFIGNVSHELKTPIALIQGYAEGLKEGVIDDPESMNYYLDVIGDEAERMNRMVKSLLTLSELESGSKQLVMERFDLVALVRNYINSADILLKEKEVKVSVIAPDYLFAWGDEFKIEEVIMNYFSNAIHHVSGNEKEIVVTVEQLGDKARVAVFNTGEHIPEEDLAHIWDKFYKVDKARTRAYGGSGVGLSIVKAIMTSFKQEYGVKNVSNGVEFWLELSTK